MGRIKTFANLVPKGDGRTLKPQPKRADPHYASDEHRKWREHVIARAGYRCEWIDGGQRCTKAEPAHRMFADHIKERQDGGAPFDPVNGQCLCGGHHTRKTAMARAARMAAPVKG